MFYKILPGENNYTCGSQIIGPGLLLKEEDRDTYAYPVDGWYWFDSPQDAEAFFSGKTVEQKIADSNRAMQEVIAQYVAGAGIAVLTLGIAAQLPKALAVKNWVASLWMEYETRKALAPTTGVCSSDYSAMPACPHTLSELIVEAGLL